VRHDQRLEPAFVRSGRRAFAWSDMAVPLTWLTMAKRSAVNPAHCLRREANLAARAMRSLLDSRLSHKNTSFATWSVLFVLDAEGPIIQRELAEPFNRRSANTMLPRSGAGRCCRHVAMMPARF